MTMIRLTRTLPLYLIALPLALLTMASLAPATNYYVSATTATPAGGQSGADGSSTRPWTETQLYAAEITLNPGDQLIVDGTLNSQLNFAPTAGASAIGVSTTGVQAPTFYSPATAAQWVRLTSRYPLNPATVDTSGSSSSAILLTDVNGVRIDSLILKAMSLTGGGGSGYNTATAVWNACIEYHATTAKSVRSQGLSIATVPCNDGHCGIWIHADWEATAPTNGLNCIELRNVSAVWANCAGLYTEEVHGTSHNSGNNNTTHFSGLKLSDSYFTNNAGNSNPNVTAAYGAQSDWSLGNGAALCSLDAAVVLAAYVEPRTGVVRGLGTLVGYNTFDYNGLYGQDSGALFTENSIGVCAGYNICSRQLAANDVDGNGLNIGRLCSDNYFYNDLVWGCAGAAIQIDGNSGSGAITNTSNTVAFNALIAQGIYNSGSYLAGPGSILTIASQANLISDGNYCYLCGNVSMGSQVASNYGAAGMTLYGDGVIAENNLIDQGAWYALGYATNVAYPTLIGNTYYAGYDGGSNHSPSPGFYATNTGTWTTSGGNLATVQTLGGNGLQTTFETYGGNSYGNFANVLPGLPASLSALAVGNIASATSPYPTNPRLLPRWFFSTGLMTPASMAALTGAIPWTSSPLPHAAFMGDPISWVFGGANSVMPLWPPQW
jgi:hypothetical protein